MDPKTQLLSFPLDLGMDVNSDPEAVQPFGDRPRVVASYNTRLTKVRGRVCKAPGSSVLAGSLDRCGGIVPSGTYDSAVAFFHPNDGGSRRIAGSAVDTLGAMDVPSSNQSAYYPALVTRAGALPAAATTFQAPAVCHDSSTGYTYYATLAPMSGGSSAIVITVVDDDGSLIIAPTVAVSFSGVSPGGGRFVALTCHGAGIVRVWYKHVSTNALIISSVTITNLTLSIGIPNTLFTPSAAGIQSVAVASDPLDTSNAYLICFTAAGTNARLLRINPATMAVSTGLDVVTGADSSAVHGIAYAHDGTTGTLIWMVSWTAGNCSLFRADPTTLATVWSQTNRMWYGHAVACGFYKTTLPTSKFEAVFAVSRAGTVASTATPAGTKAEFRSVAAGVLTGFPDMPWYGLVGQIAMHKTTNTDGWYPLLPVQALYDGTSNRYSPTSVQFLSDPSIEVMRPHQVSGLVFWDPVARVGSDFCARYPSYGIPVGSCNSFVMAGNVAKLSYVSESTAEGFIQDGFISRYVDLSFSPSNPRTAHLGSGQAIVAGALPAVWDGAEVTEFSPLRAPKITGTTTGGLGPALTGTFLFAVVISWKDAAGHLHRSPPSNTVTLTLAAQSPALFVTRPVTYRNGVSQRSVTYTIFASLDGGTTLYAQNNTVETLPATSNFWANFTIIAQPVQNALTPALYSDGGPTSMKLPYHPNACLDAKVIGDRAWLLDAERNLAYYSQPLSTEALSGIFPAFNPTQYVVFPASAGKLVALENWHEQPRFHTTSGVWTVDGEGPDALNNPPYFAAPRQLSDYPCTDAQSVVLTPIGIMFRSSNRFALAGDGFGLLDDMLANVDIIGAAVFRDQHEVVFIASTGECYVFNLLKQAWTIWQETVTGAGSAITGAVQDPWSGAVLYYSPNTRQLRKLDPSTVSTVAQISIDTGRVLPGNPQEDVMLQNYIFRAAKGGAHGVRLTLQTDYEGSQPTKVYLSTDVDEALANSRYDLWPDPRDKPARAVALSITEIGAAGEGMMPINLTLEFTRNAGKRSASLRRAGRK